MIVLFTVSLIVIVAISLIIKSFKPQQMIYKVNFTLNNNKGIPTKKVFVVNYVHNKDIVPVKNRALIRNYVI